MKNFTWKCPCCDKQHTSLPLDWSMMAPQDFLEVPPDQRFFRTKIDQNFCGVDDKFFVRGLVELPVKEINDNLRLGAWVQVPIKQGERILKAENGPNSSRHGPFKGTLRSRLNLYPDTLNLKAVLHLRDDSVPLIKIEPCEHQLHVEQRDGISVDRVIEFATALMPKH